MKHKIVLFFIILSCFTCKLFSQITQASDSFIVYESTNDSIDLSNIQLYFVDSLGYYFFSDFTDSILDISDEIELVGFTMYSGWDSTQIHYPKYDFSTKTDTTYLLLANTNDDYVHPFKGVVTSNFGWRKRRFHYGIDVNLNTGDTVVNAFHGIVRITKLSKSYGNVVVVRHENGLETLYAHLKSRFVSSGDTIKAGAPIGLGGNTGRSRGSHLHYELRYLGVAINPLDIINFDTYRLNNDTLAISKNTFDYMHKISAMKAEAKKAKWVVVKKGESLSVIASRNKTTISRLKQLNNIKGTMIRQGQKLRVR